MFFHYDYASPSAYESTRERDLVGLSVDARRPVRFHGRVVEHAFLLRVALRALGEAIWSEDTWWGAGGGTLDPIVTVHPDRLLFEAFSGDQSAYVQLRVDPALFETDGEVIPGTTNVDFTAWLWGALAEMRSSRETWFRIGAEGLDVRTVGAGGRFQPKVEVPDEWVRGFLALQEAMALPGTRFEGRAVDLLAAIRFLRVTKAKISPRAIRYEFRPGEEPRLVLEPWEEVIPFKGAEHHYAEPRTIRVWGRRKLRLLEKVLPFADRVSIYLKGRALPTFYVVHLPGMEFILGLSGWSARQWSEPGGHALLGGSGMLPDADVAPLRDLLAHRTTLDLEEAAGELGADKARVAAAFSQLCRHGSALYDLDRRAYRHRELFVDPPDFAALFPPDVRSERAAELLAAGDVDVGSCTVEENRKKRRFKTPDGPVYREVIFRDWKVSGRAGDCDAEVIIDDRGKIIFGTCQCPFFRDHLLNQGPCEHLLALFEASAGQRVDGPNSREAAAPPKRDRGFGPGGEVEGEEEDFDEEDNLEKESN